MPGAVVLSLEKLNRILEVDAHNLTLLAEPGVITERIDAAAAPHGLFYPPDPGSLKISTIGGNVANNAGGLRGFKYGVTRDYVLALEVVLPDGELAWLGSKCRKDVAGYSLRDLFIGSEGTLGVITKILLKLLPRPRRQGHPPRHFPRARRRRRHGFRHHRRAPACPAPSNFSTAKPSTASRPSPASASPFTPARCC